MSNEQLYPVEELSIDGESKEHLTSEQYKAASEQWLRHVGGQISDDTVDLSMTAVIRNGPFETQYHQFNGNNGKPSQATVNTSVVTIKTNDVDTIDIFRNLSETATSAWSEIEDEELSTRPIMNFDHTDGMTIFIPHPESSDDSTDEIDNEEEDNEN